MNKTLLTLLAAAAVVSSCSKRSVNGEIDPSNPGGGGSGASSEILFGANVFDVDTKLSTDFNNPTLTPAKPITQFTEGDRVGIFATTTAAGVSYDQLTPYAYERTGETDENKMWKAVGASLVWKKMSAAGENDHSFYAFYPYTATTTTKEKVVLPSLADQVATDVDLTASGFKLVDLIAPYDFLVARKEATDYNSASKRTPKVVGALDMEFQHALSLIEVNVIRANGAFNDNVSVPATPAICTYVEVSSLMMSANGLTAKRTANITKETSNVEFWGKASAVSGTVGVSFANTGAADGSLTATQYAKPKAPWLNNTNHMVKAAGTPSAGKEADEAKEKTPAKFYFVAYPVAANTEFQFEVNARAVKNDQTDGNRGYLKDYPLSAVYTSASKFESGKKYIFTISISDRALTVMDLTITDWLEGDDFGVVEI